MSVSDDKRIYVPFFNSNQKFFYVPFLCICEIIIGYVFLTKTSLIFDVYEIVFWLLLGIIGVLFIPFSNKTIGFKFYFGSVKRVVLFFCVCAYCAFSLIGNPIFVYPIGKAVSICELLIFFLCVIWFAPIVISFVCFILCLSKRMCLNEKCQTVNRKQVLIFRAITFFIIMLSVTVYLIGFNPGISSPDSFLIWRQARGYSELTNWHQPIVVLMYRLFFLFSESPTILITTFAVALAYSLARCLSLIYELGRGRNRLLLLLFCVIFSFAPNTGTLLITLWKDVPMLASMLLIFSYSIEIVYLKHPTTWFLLIKLSFFSFLCSSIRLYGLIYVFSVFAILFFSSKAKIRIILSSVLAALMLFIYLGPVYKYLNVVTSVPGGMYIGLGQDIRAVDEYGGNLSDYAKFISDEQTGIEGTKGFEEYHPYRAGGSNDMNYVGYQFTPDFSMFVKSYLDTAIKNPAIVIDSILCRMDCVWDIKTGVDGDIMNHAFYNNVFEDYSVPRHNNSVTNLLTEIVNGSTQSIFMSVFWRVGIYSTLIALCIYVLLLLKMWKAIIGIIPHFAFYLSLIVSCGWISYRYFQPLVFLDLLYFFLALALISERKYSDDKQSNPNELVNGVCNE